LVYPNGKICLIKEKESMKEAKMHRLCCPDDVNYFNQLLRPSDQSQLPYGITTKQLLLLERHCQYI